MSSWFGRKKRKTDDNQEDTIGETRSSANNGEESDSTSELTAIKSMMQELVNKIVHKQT